MDDPGWSDYIPENEMRPSGPSGPGDPPGASLPPAGSSPARSGRGIDRRVLIAAGAAVVLIVVVIVAVAAGGSSGKKATGTTTTAAPPAASTPGATTPAAPAASTPAARTPATLVTPTTAGTVGAGLPLMQATPFNTCTEFGAAARDARSASDEIYCYGSDVNQVGAVRVRYVQFANSTAAGTYLTEVQGINAHGATMRSDCTALSAASGAQYCSGGYNEGSAQGNQLVFVGSDFAFGAAGDTAQSICKSENQAGRGTSVLVWSNPDAAWDGIAFSCSETSAAALLSSLNQGNLDLVG